MSNQLPGQLVCQGFEPGAGTSWEVRYQTTTDSFTLYRNCEPISVSRKAKPVMDEFERHVPWSRYTSDGE